MESLSDGSLTDRGERAIPVTPAATHVRYSGLWSAVDRLRSAGQPLATPVKISEWSGDARHGRFVVIDGTTCALHVGRGTYITVDIQRDLNGVTPREATSSMLCRSGAVREPDSRRSYNAY